jgi:hypothetical protein
LWSPVLAIVAAAALGLSGCSDSTGPEQFDPVGTNQAATEVLATFTDNPAVDAIGILSSAFPSFDGGAAAAPAFSPAEDLSWPERVDDRVNLLNRVAPFLSPTNPAAVFPADFLGKTFIYDADSARYVIAPDSIGAPANGVRLKLYAIDPILERPLVPLIDVGYLDLSDESTPSADALGVLAVVQGVTYLDYLATAVWTTSSLTFTADGYASDGQTQVNFTLSHTWSETDGLTVDYDISVPSTNSAVGLFLSVNGQSEVITLELSVMHEGESVVFEATLTETSLSGSVTHEGALVVEISGTPAEPVFTDAAGNPLTEEQLRALAEIFGSVGEIIDEFDDLLIPAYLVLHVSIIGL